MERRRIHVHTDWSAMRCAMRVKQIKNYTANAAATAACHGCFEVDYFEFFFFYLGLSTAHNRCATAASIQIRNLMRNTHHTTHRHTHTQLIVFILIHPPIVCSILSITQYHGNKLNLQLSTQMVFLSLMWFLDSLVVVAVARFCGRRIDWNDIFYHTQKWNTMALDTEFWQQNSISRRKEKNEAGHTATGYDKMVNAIDTQISDKWYIYFFLKENNKRKEN